MYNPRKAAQLIAFFALKEGGEINVLKAVKLVYLSDRESIARRGHPVLDEKRVSMPHGPVNSSTLNYLNGSYRDDGGWSEFLSDRANHRVAVANQSISIDDLDELSERELIIFESVWDRFGGMDGYDLADWSHDPKNVVEWEDPNGSSRPIALAQIMAAVGLSKPIERSRELDSLSQSDSILRSL